MTNAITTTVPAGDDAERLPAIPGAAFEQPTSKLVTSWLTPQNLDGALRIADFMGKASLLPQHMQGNVGNCLLVLSIAARWGMDPFAVAGATAVVKGKLCFEGKLVAAVLIATGAVVGGLDYEFDGEGQGMSIVVTGVIRSSGKTKKYSGNVKQLRTPNEQWDKDPQSMLVYRATRQWARLYCPEVMLGINTPDELEEVQGEVRETTPATTTQVKAARTRGAKAATSDPEATTPAEQAAPAEPASPASPASPAAPAEQAAPPQQDTRLTKMLKIAEAIMENHGNLGAAELRAVNQQMGVTKLQNIPIVKLDQGLALVEKAAAFLNGSKAAGGAS